MNDFKLVVVAVIQWLYAWFNLIKSSWLLSLTFLLLIFGFVISLFVRVRGDHQD